MSIIHTIYTVHVHVCLHTFCNNYIPFSHFSVHVYVYTCDSVHVETLGQMNSMVEQQAKELIQIKVYYT